MHYGYLWATRDTLVEATVKNLYKHRTVTFIFTQRVAVFDQSATGNYRNLLIQYQSSIRFARPKQKTHTKILHDELANGSVFNFEVSILFQSMVSCFKTFINFSERKKKRKP